MRFRPSHKSATIEAVIYPFLTLLVMWSVFMIDKSLELNLYTFGVKPNTFEGIKGIVLMPFIHGQKDFSHIINNSIPTFVLMSTLIYFYRSIAGYVLLFIWIGGGTLLWLFALNTGSYHIGMSGVIYGLFGFLFVSGILRRYLPLQAISLFIVFLYGSMVWGIFPMEQGISWEGHFFGLFMGVVSAIIFRKKGPQAPKYQYEIEKDLGIDPPDLEGIWKENVERRRAMLEQKEKEKQERAPNASMANQNVSQSTYQIEYSFKPKNKQEPTKDQE